MMIGGRTAWLTEKVDVTYKAYIRRRNIQQRMRPVITTIGFRFRGKSIVFQRSLHGDLTPISADTLTYLFI